MCHCQMGVRRFLWRGRSHLRAASPAVRKQSGADAQRGHAQERFSAACTSEFRPAVREFLGRIHTGEMAPSGEIDGPPRPALTGIHCSNWKWTSLRGTFRDSRATCGRVRVTPTGSSPEAQGHGLPDCGPVTRRNDWPSSHAPLPAERAAHSRARWLARAPVRSCTLTLASERAGALRERDISLQVNTQTPEPKGHPVFEPEQEYQMVAGTARSLSLTKEFGFVAAHGRSHDVFVFLSSGDDARPSDRRVEQ